MKRSNLCLYFSVHLIIALMPVVSLANVIELVTCNGSTRVQISTLINGQSQGEFRDCAVAVLDVPGTDSVNCSLSNAHGSGANNLTISLSGSEVGTVQTVTFTASGATSSSGGSIQPNAKIFVSGFVTAGADFDLIVSAPSYLMINLFRGGNPGDGFTRVRLTGPQGQIGDFCELFDEGCDYDRLPRALALSPGFYFLSADVNSRSNSPVEDPEEKPSASMDFELTVTLSEPPEEDIRWTNPDGGSWHTPSN